MSRSLTNRKPLLSAIVPLYNCGPVISRCLDSIDYENTEILVIDDGSTDNSAQVVREYAKMHPNVRLIQKSNGGVSSARNVGIASAKGEYLVFVDADDYLAQGGLARIMQIAVDSNADVVKYGVQSRYNDSPLDLKSLADVPMKSESITGKGAALFRFDISDYHVIDGVFRKNLILEHGIQFRTDLLLREDDVFMGEFYCVAETVVITDLPIYRYIRYSHYSSTHNQPLEKRRQLIESGIQAIIYRKDCVKQKCPDALPLELLKYMRFVCHPKTALEADYSLKEYLGLLARYRSLGCYPLDYKWISVARMGDLKRKTSKLKVKTFLCNHPVLAYTLLGPFFLLKFKKDVI